MSLYSKRGVSAQKEEVHQATEKLDKGLYPFAFCKIYPDFLGRDESWVNIMHADGAGTKSILAYLYWKETGDTSLFDEHWVNAMQLVVKTFKEQQRLHDHGPYNFQRNTFWATDGVPLSGYGYPVKPGRKF